MDVNRWLGITPKASHRGIGRLPSLVLDSGIHAGMTFLKPLVYSGKHLVWEHKSCVDTYSLKLKQITPLKGCYL